MSQVHVDLSGVERALDQMGRRLSTQIDQVDTSVGFVRHDLSLTQHELVELRAEFEGFIQQAARTAAVQQSETRVVNLKAELDRAYGHYDVVRRTSVGLLQAFDVGNVTHSSVGQVSEELMIQTPRYWLAPVLVALAAWSRDDQEIAEKSVREAYSRDRNKTSLFFALVMRRQGRLEASSRWLQHYLTSLDPTALGREFAVVLEATSYNAFGPTAQMLMAETMTQWVSELRSNQEIVEQQIRRWAGEIGAQRERVLDGSYPQLEALSPQYQQLKRVLEQATALPVTIDKYSQVATHEATIPSLLENMLDDILDRLVTEYDMEELPLRRDVLYHESVIQEQGDVARARQQADLLQQALEETKDVVSIQTMAAITPELMGVSTQTQRMAIGVGQDDFRTAVGRYCTAYRSEALPEVHLAFGPNHSQYAATYHFRGCEVTTALTEEMSSSIIRRTWDETMRAYIDSVSFKNSWYTVRVLVAFGIALVVGVVAPMAGIAAALIGAGIVWYMGEQQKKQCQAAVDAATQAGKNALERSLSLYRDASAEWVDSQQLYHDLDSQEEDLLRLINTWPTAAHVAEEN